MAAPVVETLTNIAGCLDHVRNSPSQMVSLRVEASITLVDRERSLIVLQDEAAAMAVYMPLTGLALKAGQRVRVEGSDIFPYVRAFPAYPDEPSERSFLGSFEVPLDRGTYYLNRIRGYLHPPVSGQYTFWIAADDAGEFCLSPDASPAKLQKIAASNIGNAAGPREWGRYPSQRSKPVTLNAGEAYYVEALQVQSYGRGCLAVAWEGPGIERSVIEGRYLTPWGESFGGEARPSGAPSPANGLLWECWTNFFVREFDALRAHSRNESVCRIHSPKLSVVGGGELPAPERIDPDMSLAEVPNFRWVELEGDVSFAAGSGGKLQLELKREDSVLGVCILNPSGLQMERLIHSRVRVRGILEHAYSPAGELVSSVMWVTDDQQVSLLEEQGSQPGLVTQIPICEIEPSNPEMRWGRRVSVRGRIIDQATNGLVVLQGGDNYMGFCSGDGTNWTSLGRAVEIQMSKPVLAGLAVVSRHATVSSTAKFSHLKGFGTNWSGIEIGDPSRGGSFDYRDGILTVTGSGRKIGERGDQLYYLHQPLQDDGEISAQLADLSYSNALTQVGPMIRESSDARSSFAAVLFTPAHGPAFQYRRNLGDPVIGYESKDGRDRFRWMKLVKRDSLLLVRGRPDSKLDANQEVDVTGVITWQDNTPILTDAIFASAPQGGSDNRPAVNQTPLSIGGFVARAQHPPEPYLLGRMPSPNLRGVVTFCGDFLGENMMFVQSGEEGGVRVGWADTTVRPEFEVGQMIEVQGLALVRKFPVILQPSDIKQLGRGTLPKPGQYSSALVKDGSGHARWVEAFGVVRSRGTNGLLSLMTQDGVLTVWVGQRQATNAQDYVDAMVRVRGVLSLDSARNAYLLVPSSEFVEMLERPSVDPFAIPRFSIADLATLEVKPERMRRMKTGGVVTCSLPKGVYFQDETGGAYVQTSDANVFHPGDRIEVVGFPDNESAAVMISEAAVRKISGGASPKPMSLSIDEFGQKKFAGMLVGLEAMLLEQRNTPEAQLLTLQVGTKIFEAACVTGEAELMPQMPVGSRVAITGVCQVDQGVMRAAYGEAQPAMVTKIWLPSAASAVLLARPPWWTTKRVVWLGSIFAIGLLGALIWVRLLRRRVTQKTRELQATMARLEKETRTSAMLAERDRLAGEIHDSLEQSMTAIMLQLDAANKQSDQSPEARKFVRMARNMAEFGRTEVQHAVWDMRSPLLANADLGAALKHVAGQISSGSPEVKVEIIGTPRSLPSSPEHHLLRIAQEAITNAIKHARARSINVALDYSGPDLKLTIADDGGGFVPNAVREQGQGGRFGLHGIRARAKKIDARLDIKSQIGAGTVITVQMKLNGNQAGVTSENQKSL